MNNGYYFAEACKNTFLLFDYLSMNQIDQPALQQACEHLIKEKRDDAMLLFEGQVKGDSFFARMLVLGVDGALGEFCGNGARACAAYLFSRYPEYLNFYLVSNRGIHQLSRYQDGTYSIQLPPINFEPSSKFVARADRFSKNDGCYSFLFEGKHFVYADVIEPHLIIQEEINDEELLRLGHLINQQKDFFPLGINVNSCRVLDDNSILVRTYERAVQKLTQSCGTGSCCSAAWHLKGKDGTVSATTLGGNLEITVRSDGINLKGPATIESFQSLNQAG